MAKRTSAIAAPTFSPSRAKGRALAQLGLENQRPDATEAPDRRIASGLVGRAPD